MTTPEISATTDGPYEVRGGERLVRARIVRNAEGVPVAWDVYEEIDTSGAADAEGTYWLCRCGASDHKPFCDGSHKRIGFDGTANAPEGTYEERAKVYAGPQRVLLDDRPLCEHAGFCSNGTMTVWKMSHLDEPGLGDEMAAMVARCPSGAITLRGSGTTADLDADVDVMVAVTDNGPLFVTGGVPITDQATDIALEPRPRVTLCRCGASAMKPYCDGSHAAVGFADPSS